MSREISLESTIVNPGMNPYRDLSQHRIWDTWNPSGIFLFGRRSPNSSSSANVTSERYLVKIRLVSSLGKWSHSEALSVERKWHTDTMTRSFSDVCECSRDNWVFWTTLLQFLFISSSLMPNDRLLLFVDAAADWLAKWAQGSSFKKTGVEASNITVVASLVCRR